MPDNVVTTSFSTFYFLFCWQITVASIVTGNKMPKNIYKTASY